MNIVDLVCRLYKKRFLTPGHYKKHTNIHYYEISYYHYFLIRIADIKVFTIGVFVRCEATGSRIVGGS